MKKLYKVMIGIGVLMFIGTAGAVDHDGVSIWLAAVQTLSALVLVGVGAFGIRLEERRSK